MKTRAWAAALLAASLVAPCAAGDPPEITDAEVKRLAGQVTEIASKQLGLLDRLDLTRRRVRLAESVLSRVHRQQAATKKALEDATAKSEALASQQREIEKYLRLRMRQQYALGVLQEYRVFFAVSSVQDLRAAGFYVQALAEKDAKSLHQLAALRAQQEAARSELGLLGRQLDKQGQEAMEEKQNLLSEQGRLSALLARLSQERQAAQQALDELLQAGRKVDRYVADLSEKPLPETNATAKNMSLARGQLSFPCRGSVVKGFGDAIHPRFHTRVPHPGLDIEAPLGTPVNAVYPGKVEFSDWLSGYGYTVILSHPGGYFTVYGHLDQIQARKGETVKQNQVIGTVGENAFAASTALYFELRQGGKAVDPSTWLIGGGR